MSEYKIEDCSLYRESCVICGKPVYVFEKHNFALPAWGTISSRIGHPASLISFDSHTDTHWGFNAHVCKITGKTPNFKKHGLDHPIIQMLLKEQHYMINDFSFEDVLKITANYLKNTEQILCAVDFGYLSSYTIVLRKNGAGLSFEGDDRLNGYNATYISRETWNNWDTEQVNDPIIIDFDLDFFVKRGDFNEDLKRMLTPLLKRCIAITVAREPRYFEDCKEERTYTNEMAFEQLLEFIKDGQQGSD